MKLPNWREGTIGWCMTQAASSRATCDNKLPRFSKAYSITKELTTLSSRRSCEQIRSIRNRLRSIKQATDFHVRLVARRLRHHVNRRLSCSVTYASAASEAVDGGGDGPRKSTSTTRTTSSRSPTLASLETTSFMVSRQGVIPESGVQKIASKRSSCSVQSRRPRSCSHSSKTFHRKSERPTLIVRLVIAFKCLGFSALSQLTAASNLQTSSSL